MRNKSPIFQQVVQRAWSPEQRLAIVLSLGLSWMGRPHPMHFGRSALFAMIRLQRVVYMNLFLFKQARLDDSGVNRWGRVVAFIHSNHAFLCLHFSDKCAVVQVVEHTHMIGG